MLAKNASKEDILNVLKLADGADQNMAGYVRAVLSVSVIINKETVKEIKEEGIMPEAVRILFGEELEEERKAGRDEKAQEDYERMRAANIPEEQARAIAFG